MKEELKRQLVSMSLEEQQARFDQLQKTPGIGQPVSTAHGNPPAEVDLQHLEEYQYLQELLGYR